MKSSVIILTILVVSFCMFSFRPVGAEQSFEALDFYAPECAFASFSETCETHNGSFVRCKKTWTDVAPTLQELSALSIEETTEILDSF